MDTTTKISGNTSNNMVDLAFKGSKNVSSKSETESYKTNSYNSTSRNEDFKTVLNSKASSKQSEDKEEIDNVNRNNDLTKVNDNADDQVKDKLEELEEESKSDSKDKVSDVLTELLNLLAKFGIKEEDLKSNGEINSETLKSMLEGIGNVKSSNSSLNDVMSKIMELLKNDSVKEGLDTSSLKLMEKILGNLSANLADDNKEGSEVKNGIKSLMSEISDMLQNKQVESKKVLTMDEMLNKNYSQSNSEDSADNETNNSSASKDSKVISKEDKFLNSLIDDKDDSLDKINLFASRSSAIQNQGVNTVRGLTVNKATFVEDLIKDVKFMNSNGLKELTVKVNPGNLGEITIRLTQEDGIMKANLKANSKETTALLSQNLLEIKKQLGEQNIKITDVNIDIYQEDTSHFKGEGFEGQLAGEQKQQNDNSRNSLLNNKVVSSNDSLDENLAKDNSNINMFA